MDKLSVAGIMPLYNKRNTVIEAIESMLEQSHPVDEIVIVDDGSTDGSGDLVAERYDGDSRVRLIRQENQGPGAARNRAIRATRSSLLAFLDADDRWLPNRLKKQVAFMESHPSCMLSFAAHISCNEATSQSRVENMYIDKRIYLHKVFFREDALPASNTVMVRREALSKVGFFDESLRRCQDTDLWLRIMVEFGFEHIPQPLGWVRRGRPRTVPSKERGFAIHDRYFAKHRYTFGRGFRGQAIWRAGYASAHRAYAAWYFRHGMGREAMAKLMKSIFIWPFFNPVWMMKYVLEFMLGSDEYRNLVSIMRILKPNNHKELVGEKE